MTKINTHRQGSSMLISPKQLQEVLILSGRSPAELRLVRESAINFEIVRLRAKR